MKHLYPLVLLSAGAIWVAGCGEVKIDDTVGVSEDADGSADATVAGDNGSGDHGQTDGAVDSAAADVPAECVTDFDCVLSSTVKGKNPCSPPVCDAGKCVTKKKAANVPCIDSSLAPLECERMACNDNGICAIFNKKDGAGCGLGACGHKCEVGLCVGASATDYDDNNACTKDYCNQGDAVIHEPITDLTAFCDDGDACLANDTCVQGVCKGLPVQCSDGIECTTDTCDPKVGCVAQAKDTSCDDGDACTAQKCDKTSGCKVDSFVTGGKCNDGNACTNDDKCSDKGACGGTATCSCKVDSDCKQDNLCLGAPTCSAGVCVSDPTKAVVCDGNTGSSCLLNLCDAKTGACGVVPVDDGKGCDDTNACSSISTCEAGKCEGLFDIKCDDKNGCTDDVCNAQAGCTYVPNDGACTDASACTTGDACSKGACGGAAKNCDDSVACTTDACDAKTGACTNTSNSGKCDDGNPCTADTCDATAGCKFAANDAAVCEDGDPCTQNKCAAGKCTSTTVCQCKDNSGCNDSNACTVDTCSAGKCTNAAAPQDGKPCDTGDKCQVAGSGVCGAGACKTSNKPITCTTPGVCQASACNPATGKCENSNKPDGLSCDADANGCTQADKCVAGKCSAGNTANCAGSASPCADGVCKSTGPGTFSCNAVAKAAGTACEDDKYCTAADTCDATGKCTAGAALSCAAQNDACNTGTCDETKKQCLKVPKATTVGCDDTLYCSTGDHCDSLGKCVGSAAINCPSANCAVGTCDEVNNKCATKPAASGAACTDSSVCTGTDACDAVGLCKGANPLVCDDKNACTKDSCDPIKGCIYTPTAGSVCDDLNACTTGDKCDATGKCQAGAFTCQCTADSGCNDGNVCTTDKCATNKCQNTIAAGAVCDDKNPCSLTSACDASGACVPDATKPYDCAASADACNTASCYDNVGVAACKKVPKVNTTGCDDGLFCTTGDLCNGTGKCVGGAPPLCGKPAACNTSVCAEAAKGCTTQAQTKGTACDDVNPCTSGDACDGAGKCAAGSVLPDFSLCSDGNAGTSADFCYKQVCGGFAYYAGPVGPSSAVAATVSPAGYYTTSLAEPKLSATDVGAWGLFAHGGITTWTFKQAMSAGSAAKPLTGISEQIISGYGAQVWFSPQGSGVWQGPSNPFFSALQAVAPSATDWYAVDSKVIASTLYVGLVGFSAVNNVSALAQCSGDVKGAAAAKCTIKAYSPALRMTDSRIRTHTPCLTCAATPVHVVLGLVQSSSAGLYQAANSYEAPWGSTYATKLGPSYAASSVTSAGIWQANTSFLAPQTGSTARWLVGPAGLVAYEKNGTTGLFSAAVTKAVQSNYSFKSVLRIGGFTLLFGSKPDPLNANSRLPLFLAHDEVVNTQSGYPYWTELTLDPPTYNATCIGNASSGSDAVVGPNAILGFINVCSLGAKGGTISTRTTTMFHRNF